IGQFWGVGFKVSGPVENLWDRSPRGGTQIGFFVNNTRMIGAGLFAGASIDGGIGLSTQPLPATGKTDLDNVLGGDLAAFGGGGAAVTYGDNSIDFGSALKGVLGLGGFLGVGDAAASRSPSAER